MNNGYSIITSVNVHDVDYNGVAKASAVLKYLQTAADSQLNDNGMSYLQLRDMGRAFLLSRLKLEINEPIREGEPLRAITFPCESRGYSFLRCYALERDGITVARAVSLWALLDTNSHSLVRVNDFDLNLPLLPPLSLEMQRLRLPDVMTEVGNYGVHYGDVDRNMHMNNTKYPNMYSNFLPLDGKRIRSVTINYSNEAKMGERLKVLRAESEGLYYFRTVRADGRVNSEAEIELCEI